MVEKERLTSVHVKISWHQRPNAIAAQILSYCDSKSMSPLQGTIHNGTRCETCRVGLVASPPSGGPHTEKKKKVKTFLYATRSNTLSRVSFPRIPKSFYVVTEAVRPKRSIAYASIQHSPVITYYL